MKSVTDPFSPISIRGMVLPNRFMRSATHDGSADESGAVTEKSLSIYRTLGEGDIGLVVSGFAFVSEMGQALPGQYGAHSDGMIPGLKRMAAAVHTGGGRIALQIVHAGAASPHLMSRGVPGPAPSRIEGRSTAHREMTSDEIEAAVRDFGAAAARAREAGFDAVQLHAAHGYLMSQFLSPLTNRRTDGWGGSPEKRCRFHVEVTRQVRLQAGRDFPLLIKLGIMDDDPGGTTLAEGLAAAQRMVQAGADAVEVSAGVGGDFFKRTVGRECIPEAEKPLFLDRTAALKGGIPVPTALVGGIRSLETVRAVLAAGQADMVAMSRAFIREPGLVRRWAAGDVRPARCLVCNQCYRLLSTPEPLPSYCWQEHRSRA
ncbi:MAG: NADH:flavin oxidoreductase [Chloroflexi bacterium]|nr:NADH:flavin oxidoreductase [Chloroflexota bacterium]